jgi:GST-like protein
MNDLSAFPITRKWPAQHPDRIQLYSLPTPNGVKVSIMLVETGLPYEPHLVSFETNDQLSPEFLSLNPNNKIPAIIDPHGPDGKPWRCSSRAPSCCTWRARAGACPRTPRATRRCSG